MPKKLYYCDLCKLYTMQESICPKCNGQVHTPHPPKYSPQDKYQKYRITYFKKKFEGKFNEKEGF